MSKTTNANTENIMDWKFNQEKFNELGKSLKLIYETVKNINTAYEEISKSDISEDRKIVFKSKLDTLNLHIIGFTETVKEFDNDIAICKNAIENNSGEVKGDDKEGSLLFLDIYNRLLIIEETVNTVHLSAFTNIQPLMNEIRDFVLNDKK